MSIPATIQASVAVARGSRYEGELPIKLLPRLAEQVQATGASLKVELKAGRETGYWGIQGGIRGTLALVCQRCEKPFDWQLDADVNLRLVRNEAEEKEFLQDSDPYVVQDDDVLPLRELVEDEVLLALPMLPRCESCENSVQQAAPETARKPEPARENPFAALKGQLKH